MTSLRQIAKQDAGETLPVDRYARQIRQLMDKHVMGVAVNDPGGHYDVNKLGNKPEEWSKEKLRNETDLIKTRISKTIEQDLRDDPYAQDALSELLRQLIEDAEKQFDTQLKLYLRFKEFEKTVRERRAPDMPEALSDNRHARAHFGVFKKVLPETFGQLDHAREQEWINLALAADRLVQEAVAMHSINPENIEAEIRNKLLPPVFKQCKAAGGDINQAKAIVEWIVQIMRVGLEED